MRRVCVVITARPSYSRVKTVLTALQARPNVELQVIAAASALVTRYGRVVDIIRADGFPVVAELSSVVEEDSLANSAVSTGLLLAQLAGTFERLKPDVVVTIADRHETLATAIAASYQNIPLCHIQGGEVSGSIDDKVRNAVTQLADIHCVASHSAAERVGRKLRERFEPVVHVTGCPSIDLAYEAIRLGPLPGTGADPVVLQHSVTGEVEASADQMRATVEAIGRWKGAVFFWPGEDAGGQAMAKVLRLAGITPRRNMPPLDFLRLLYGARFLIGNSSVGIRECAAMGVNVINLGSRQAGRERGYNVTDLPHDAGQIREDAERLYSAPRAPRSLLYGDGHAGERIAKILAEEV